MHPRPAELRRARLLYVRTPPPDRRPARAPLSHATGGPRRIAAGPSHAGVNHNCAIRESDSKIECWGADVHNIDCEGNNTYGKAADFAMTGSCPNPFPWWPF